MSERSFKSSENGAKISVSKNEKLLISHLKKVSSDDEEKYLDATTKMTKWLVSEKAYYEDAQSYIELIIQNARNTLWRLNPEKDIDLSQPGPSSLEPRRLSYWSMLETAIPHLRLFVNKECRSSLMDLALQAGFPIQEEMVDAPVASGSNVTIEQQKKKSTEKRNGRHHSSSVNKQSSIPAGSPTVFNQSPAGNHSSMSPLTYTRIKLESTESTHSYSPTQSISSSSHIQPLVIFDNATPPTSTVGSLPQSQQSQRPALPKLSILTNHVNEVPLKVPLNTAPNQTSSASPFAAPSPATSIVSTSTSLSVPPNTSRRPMLPGQLPGQKASLKIVSDSLKQLDLQWFENTKSAEPRPPESTDHRVASTSGTEDTNQKGHEGSVVSLLKPVLTINTSMTTKGQESSKQIMYTSVPSVSSFSQSNIPPRSASTRDQDIPKAVGNVRSERQSPTFTAPVQNQTPVTNPFAKQQSSPVPQTNVPFVIPSIGDQTYSPEVSTAITNQHPSNPHIDFPSDSISSLKAPREFTSPNYEMPLIKQELDALDKMPSPAVMRRDQSVPDASSMSIVEKNNQMVNQTPLVPNVPSGVVNQSPVNGSTVHGRSASQSFVNSQSAVLPLSLSPQIQARLSLGPSINGPVSPIVERQAVSGSNHSFYPPSVPTYSFPLRYINNQDIQDSRDMAVKSQEASGPISNGSNHVMVPDIVSSSSGARPAIVESKVPVNDGAMSERIRVPKRSFSAEMEELDQRPNHRRRVTEGQAPQVNGYHQMNTLSNGSRVSSPVNNLRQTPQHMSPSSTTVQYVSPPPKSLSPISFYVPETTVLVDARRGEKEKSSFVIDFTVEPEIFDYLAVWNKRYDHFSDVSRAMCISLACYKITDKVKVWSTLSGDSIRKLVSCLPSRWPKNCGLRAHIRLGSLSAPAQAEFGLAHSAVWTVDGFVDISPFINNEGRVFITVEHTVDVSDYAFILYAHHPTINQLRQLAERRNADESWRNMLSQLSRPLPYQTFHDFFDHAVSENS